ncbi:alpha/beta fold hydrolase [Streptomyces sp. NPDC050287]|uniref:alpha/beta fold hydrolase n=1 Tax=Streptomyces sp. NPDC050287 TaxID=3365608 RepID=UPI0037B514DC
MTFTRLSVRSGPLDVGIETAGPEGGWPVLLLHGFPYDPHSFEPVAAELAVSGVRVLAPYLRGFGATRFVSESTPRSGQQAAVGRDVLNLVETLELGAPILVGYDWGDRAACVAAALRPDLIGGTVALGATPSKTSLHPPSRRRRLMKVVIGTSTTFMASAGASASPATAGSWRTSFGASGRRHVSSTMRISSGRRRRSTTPTSSRSSFTPIGIDSDSWPVIHSTRMMSDSWPASRPSTCPRSSLTQPRTPRCIPARVSSTSPDFRTSLTIDVSIAVTISLSTLPQRWHAQCASCGPAWNERGVPRPGGPWVPSPARPPEDFCRDFVLCTAPSGSSDSRVEWASWCRGARVARASDPGRTSPERPVRDSASPRGRPCPAGRPARPRRCLP